MPFLRILRDKRGYETTYLMHWFREGGRQRSRVLYLFRTPGGVRVGRLPLEPDVLRQIELRYPEIAFDWSVVRENQQVIEPPPEYRRRKPKREDSDEDGPVAASEPVAPEPVAPVPAAPAVAQVASPPARPIPSSLGGGTPGEQIIFLTEWYPIVCERIVLRTADPLRREALAALAEQLNSSAWTDDERIAAGLHTAAEALERLSRVLARRRRGSRRRSGDRKPAGADANAAEAGAADAGPEVASAGSDDTGDLEPLDS